MARERLDVEDDEGRAARLGNLFTSISNAADETPAMPFPQPPSRPHAVPESDVLARARAFLPLLAASNADILSRAKEDPASVVIENPSAGDVVAMDVGLGVFDVQGSTEGMPGPVVERDAEVWERANEEDEEEDEEDEEDEDAEGEDIEEDHDDEKPSDKPTPKVVEI